MYAANPPDASASSAVSRSTCEEGEDAAAAVPVEKWHRWVAVSFCGFCILHIALNISLHSAFALQRRFLTEERDDLRKKLDDFNYFSQNEWVYYNGSFYYISSILKTWQQSREDCLQKKADLIIINSKKEQDFFQKFRKAMWIGLTDRETEGVWKWVDGTLLTTSVSFWGPDEPNSYQGKDEDCAVTRYHGGEESWNDDKCETVNLWICEKTMTL